MWAVLDLNAFSVWGVDFANFCAVARFSGPITRLEPSGPGAFRIRCASGLESPNAFEIGQITCLLAFGGEF